MTLEAGMSAGHQLRGRGHTSFFCHAAGGTGVQPDDAARLPGILPQAPAGPDTLYRRAARQPKAGGHSAVFNQPMPFQHLRGVGRERCTPPRHGNSNCFGP